MNTTTTLTALAALTLFGTATALQQPLAPTLSPLTGQQTGRDFEAARWATALEEGDLNQRMAAYEAVMERAQSDSAVYEEVSGWAADTSNPGLSWTAQLMLRELQLKPRKGLLSKGNPWLQPGFPDLSRIQEDLLQQFKVGNPLTMDDLDWGLGSRLNPDLGGPGLQPNTRFESSTFSLGSGRDGVKLEVQEHVDGQLETKTYEAETMEELLEAHPELTDRIGGAQRFQWPAPRGRADYQPFSGQGRQLNPNQGLRPLRPSLDMLGVRMLLPETRQIQYAGIPADVGLQVIEVIPGTLADVLGIEPDDLVTSIAGRTIRTPEDVREALDSVTLDERIEVNCVGPDGKTEVRVWEPKTSIRGRSL